tara:strand:+ start:124295 stop:124690 length:396 start_codon:yes stop_codon:yes gene_type:complete
MISVDLTSMIDVVFQLIIFFMFTSQFSELRRTEIDLPRQPGEEISVRLEPSMIVDLTHDGQYLVESKNVDLNVIEQLARAGVSSQNEADPFDVLIRPDRNASVIYLDRLLLRLSETGVQRWKLATVEGGES